MFKCTPNSSVLVKDGYFLLPLPVQTRRDICLFVMVSLHDEKHNKSILNIMKVIM